jgi:nitronate monooxygenase
MWNKTRISEIFNISYPIIQGPFGGGLSSIELTSAVSNAGALGSFGGQPYTAEEIIRFCLQIRNQTNKPININLWVNNRDERLSSFNDEDYKKLIDLFRPYFNEMGLEIPEKPRELGPEFDQQLEAIYEIRPEVFSFVYGIPNEQILEKCKSLAIKTLGAATTADEAKALEHAGVDAIVATGFEAGGHRVSFLKTAEESLTGTFSLIPQVVDSVKIPVIAAGGIADARGVKAALALGAEGVQIGTAFLATNQSNATQDHKDILFTDIAKQTILTKIYTGRLSRGIKNRLIDEINNSEHLLAPYPLQGKFMSHLKAYPPTANSNPDFKSYWAGQSASLLKYRDAIKLINSIVDKMNVEIIQKAESYCK